MITSKEQRMRAEAMARENGLRAMVRECQEQQSRLTDWEKDFLKKVATVSQLTAKQAATLTELWRKLKRPVGKIVCVLKPGGVSGARPAALGEKGYSV